MKKIVKLPASLFESKSKIILNFIEGKKIIDKHLISLYLPGGQVQTKQIDNNNTIVSSILDDTY